MVYEFIAVRFLQRHFGGTLDVWAAEIAVCMGGLAAGYAVGGYLADRLKSWGVLGLVLMLAGIAATGMEPIADALGNTLINLEPAWWHPLVAAGACSFLPLLALGTVMPQAVRLHVTQLGKVGISAGWIAALSTCGSIVGVLLTGMIFMVRYGVRETLWGVSALVFTVGAVSLAASWIAARRRTIDKAAVKSLVLLLALIITRSATPAPRERIIYERYTAYHHILVEDEGDKRILWFDNAPQSTMSKRAPADGAFEYTDFFHMPMVLNPTIQSVLFVGLGGGSGPKAFLRDYVQQMGRDLRIEAVEIDPEVVRIAHAYFAVPQVPQLRIAVADGRLYLRRATNKYGAIIMDAYGSSPYGAYLPYHLATREFFQIAKDRLVDGGCLVYNCIGELGGKNDYVIRTMKATLTEAFKQVYVFRAKTSVNTVFVAIHFENDASTETGNSWPDGPWRQHPLDGPALSTLAATLLSQGKITQPILVQRMLQFSPAHGRPLPGKVMTDNYAPTDVSGQFWGGRR